jgi:hypothetical protein
MIDRVTCEKFVNVCGRKKERFDVLLSLSLEERNFVNRDRTSSYTAHRRPRNETSSKYEYFLAMGCPSLLQLQHHVYSLK